MGNRLSGSPDSCTGKSPLTTTIACVDVGQGDCTLVVDHDTSSAVIIDCRLGGDAAALTELHQLGADTVSAIVASHTHRDHLLGLPAIVEATERLSILSDNAPFYVNIDTLRGSQELVRAFRYIVEKVHDGVIQVFPATEGQAGCAGNTTWTILGPAYVTVVTGAIGDRNLASAIVQITVTGWTGAILISGDATLSAWESAHAATPLPQQAYVRWPHHGGSIGNASAHEDLYRLLDPALVVVSVGNGSHPSVEFRTAAAKHPSPTLCTGAGRGCPSVSTSCRGTIRVTVAGDSATVTSDYGSPGPGCCDIAQS